MKYLLLYDINGKIDPCGIRIRIVRELRKIKAINIQKSTWIMPEIPEKLRSLLLEAENIGASVIVNEYEPIKVHKGLFIGLVKSPSLEDYEFLKETREAFIAEDLKLKEKSYGKLSEYKTPSEAVNALYGEEVDAVVFLTKAKNMENAMYMGYAVLSKSYLLGEPVAFVELAKVEDSNKYVAITWTQIPSQISSILSSRLNLTIINGSSLPQERITTKGRFVYRRVFGVSPGEKIYIGDIPIAKAESESIMIISHKGQIVDVMGASLDHDKLKNLGKVKLETAMIKSFKN